MKTYRLFRIVWGILFLLSLSWLALGLSAAGSTAQEVGAQTTSDAGRLGVAVGTGLTVSVVLCTALPLLLIFGLLYWRNGVGMRHAREHAELLEAQRQRVQG